ncbi:MAG: hypothetical protein IT458_15870 [Planctomycetes bacterium]|nr:hypothetical protein [Planctomycetota bacterium]
MHSSERGNQLIRVLEEVAESIGALRSTMVKNRMALVAVRGSELEQGLAVAQREAERLAGLEERRRDAQEQLRAALGAPGDAPWAGILARVPAEVARRLRAAHDAVRGQARALRVEVAVGRKLLGFSRDSLEAMFRALLQASEGAAKGYDRNARVVAGTPAGTTGRLVRGTV